MTGYLLEFDIMQMSDYLTRTPIISLKEFTVDGINNLGWESDLFMRPPRFFQVLFTQFI